MAPKSTSMKTLLVLTAAVEAATGMGLLISPSLLMQTLVGASLDTPAGLLVARVAGVALLSLAMACWLARNDGASRATRGLPAALLLYNAGAAVAVAHARVGTGLSGIGLWPVVLVHLLLATWCLACLRIERVGTSPLGSPPSRSNRRSTRW